MFGRSSTQRPGSQQRTDNGQPGIPATLLTVVGDHARMEGKFEIAETGRVTGNIETDSLVISKGGFFNGNVIKIKDREREAEAQKGPRPVYLVEEKRLGQQK